MSQEIRHQTGIDIGSVDSNKHLSKCTKFEENDAQFQFEEHILSRLNRDHEESSFEEAKEDTHDDPLDAAKYTKGIVPETDDPSLPAFTFRAILIGTFFNIILSVTDAIFRFRTNRISIPGIVSTIAAYPMGVFMAKVLPSGFLNPGPFSPKEQIIATVIASAGGAEPAGLDNVVIQYYKGLMNNKDVNIWNALAWVIFSQLLGFGLAGVARKFLVRPKKMLWPSTLGTIALVTSFHEMKTEKDQHSDDEVSSQYTTSRFKFFWIVTGISFVYAWLPQFFIPAMASIPLICLITESKEWKFLGSPASNAGTGLGTITLDSNYLSGSAMTSPYWATCNSLLGNAIWWYILVPMMFYSDAFGRDTSIRVKKSPYSHAINTVSLFSSKTNTSISALEIMNTTTYDLDMTAYQQHAPLRLASGFAAHYGVSFMALTATVAHVMLWHGSDIFKQAKGILKDTAYVCFLGVIVVLNILICSLTPFQLPWYYIILAVPMSVAFVIPIGIIVAVSGKPVSLGVLFQFFLGYMNPGKTIWLMTFKTFGLDGIKNAVELLKNLKLGHYMHIDPKSMVYAQIYATVVAGFFNTVVSFMVMNVWFADVLGTEDWSYSSYKQAYSTAAIFGAIGPSRFFGSGSVYESLLWFFPIGFILPFLPWLGNRFCPSKRWQLINIPLLSSMQNPQQKQNYLISSFIVATITQWYAFNYHYDWFQKYNYIMSIGVLLGATVVALLVVVMKTNGITMPKWAGTVDLESYCLQDWELEDALSTNSMTTLFVLVKLLIIVTILMILLRQGRS